MKTIISGREQGAVAPLVAILMVVLIPCIALVVDLGRLHNVKVQLQRAVDAAALAGAQQLNGSADQDYNAEKVARATAASNRADGRTGLTTDGGWVDESSVVINLGKWDTEITGAVPDDRFDDNDVAENTANAIRVKATLDVDNIFFFLPDNSTVSADAIAVSMYKETALPIALLSCIPINEGTGSTICDIGMYKFGVDPEDTAGWTALTYPINADQLKYFFTPEGNAVVNQILYGTGDGRGGLENKAVIRGDSTYDPSVPCGDKNVELDIRCGLGPDFVNDPAPDDPFDYVLNSGDSLPRWDDDAFVRIYSMNGILLQDYVPGETDAEYQTRLDALKAASRDDTWATWDDVKYPMPSWAKDGRFDVLIAKAPNGPNNIAYFDRALLYAGYPSVRAKNGVDNAVIQEFIDLTTEAGHFKDSQTKVNVPLDATSGADPNSSYGGGDTMAVTIPVIFAGLCGEWKSLKGKYYIGTANLLITRLWNGKNECYDASDPVKVYGSPPCDINDFSPRLGGAGGDEYKCVTGQASGAEAGIEALITPRGEEGPSGIQKIYLVE